MVSKLYCTSCGYDFAGIETATRCPECGGIGREAREPMTVAKASRRAARVAMWLLLAHALVWGIAFVIPETAPIPLLLVMLTLWAMWIAWAYAAVWAILFLVRERYPKGPYGKAILAMLGVLLAARLLSLGCDFLVYVDVLERVHFDQ